MSPPTVINTNLMELKRGFKPISTGKQNIQGTAQKEEFQRWFTTAASKHLVLVPRKINRMQFMLVNPEALTQIRLWIIRDLMPYC